MRQRRPLSGLTTAFSTVGRTRGGSGLFSDAEAPEASLDALEDVILLSVRFRDLPGDHPLVLVRDIDSPVGIVLDVDLTVDPRRFHLPRVARRPILLDYVKRIHSIQIIM